MELEDHKQFSQLDQFKIIKKLGSGLQATYNICQTLRVKLGEDDNGNKVAIKKYRTQRRNMAAFDNEIKIVKQFNHQNIIKLLESRPQATYTKKNGTQYQCTVNILEYAAGGQLFDYIADSGSFSQKATRSYFGQLMNGLHHMHTKGFVHRDLKPQNLLLTGDFMLKISDFGFSCHKMKHNGVLQTKLGTHGYMAPEIYKYEYNGEKTDVFAAGVILFLMLTSMPPFAFASKNDDYYKFIFAKRYDKFWKEFEKKKGKNFFTPEFKDLIQKMFAYDPNQRPTIVQIAQHPWIKGEIPSFEELKADFEKRQAKVRIAIEKKRQQEQRKKKEALEVKEKLKKNGGINMRKSGHTKAELFVFDLMAEQYLNRKVPVFESIEARDWLISDKLADVVVNLKDFLNKLQIDMNCDPLSDDTPTKKQEELLHLKELQDSNQNEILAKFTFENAIGQEQDIETVNIVMKFVLGRDKKGNTVLRSKLQEGDWFYGMRLTAEIKRIFANKILLH